MLCGKRKFLRAQRLALIGIACLTACPALADDDPQSSEIVAQCEALRRQGQFTAAEQLCQQKLADSQLPDAQRAELTIAWSQTLLEHALQSPPPERDALWGQAHEVARRFGLEHPRHVQLALVHTQGALVTLARGETLRQQAALAPNNRELAAAARDALRQAIREFTAVKTALEVQLRQPAKPRSEKPVPNEESLRHLLRQNQLRLARALRNQAQLFAPQSPERSDALNLALEQIAPLATLDDRHPVAWPARVEQLTVLRLLEDYPACTQQLDALTKRPIPAEWATQVQVERLYLQMAEGNFVAAAATVEQPRPADWPAAPELDLAELELWLTLLRDPGDTTNQDKPATRPRGQPAEWQARADRVVARIEAQHGVYWSRRAEALLAAGVATVNATMSRDALAKTADGLARAGRWEDSLAAYDAAAVRAREERETALAFDLSFRAATLLHQRKSHAAAAERFRRLALEAWDHPRAAEAHLLAIYNAGQPPPAEDSDVALTALLEEHLRHWPQAESAGEARWQLGKQHQRSGQWQAAIEAYRGIAATHPRGVESVGAVGGCYRQWLKQLRGRGESTDGVADAAWQYLAGLALDDRGQLRDKLTPRELSALQAAAELRLAYAPDQAAGVVSLLQSAMQRSNEAHQALLPAWTWAQATLGNDADVRAALPHLAGMSPPEMVELLVRLADGRAALPDGPRKTCDRFRAELAELALPRRDGLEPADQRTFDRIYARALADIGNVDTASRYYDQLAAAHPRDAEVLAEHARFLSERGDRAALEAALAKWRQLERGSRPPAQRWFEAKYELAQLHMRLGNAEQAAKLVTVTQALHPDLGGPQWKAKFLEILEQTKR